MTLKEFVEYLDFTLVEDGSTFKLKDNESVNFGDIEGDEFCSEQDVVERLDNYIWDYIRAPMIDALKEKDMAITHQASCSTLEDLLKLCDDNDVDIGEMEYARYVCELTR